MSKTAPIKTQDRLLSTKNVCQMIDFSAASLYRLCNSDDPVLRFPSATKIGHSSRWVSSEVEAWITRQKDRRAV